MFNWTFKTQGHRHIGLDIGHDSIKMMQLAVNGAHVKVLAADKIRLDPGLNDDPNARRDFIVATLADVLNQGRYRTRDVVSCLPDDCLKITSLRLPDAPKDQIEIALRNEAVQRFGLDAQEDVIDYLVAGSIQQGEQISNEMILFAASSQAVREHIEMLERAGLTPVAIDTVPTALFRTFERSLRRRQDWERTNVFVDVGSYSTTVVFASAGEISFVKQLPIAGRNFKDQIADKLGISHSEVDILRAAMRNAATPENSQQNLVCAAAAAAQGTTHSFAEQPFASQMPDDAEQDGVDPSTRQTVVDAIGSVAEQLAKEISLCFRYYTVTFRGKRVDKAVFAGGEAYENILLNVLRRQLAVQVEIAQPLRGFDMTDVNLGSDRRSPLCEWATAVGLALRGTKLDSPQTTGDAYERN